MEWEHIRSEEEGEAIVRTIIRTRVCAAAACGSDGRTLLHLAAHRGYSCMVEQLLKSLKGRDINWIDEAGYTPVYYALQAERYVSSSMCIKC